MGLFDQAFDEMSPQGELGKEEAFAGILLTAVASDGHVSDEERRGLIDIVSRMKMYDDMGHRFGKMMDRLEGMLKRMGYEDLLMKAAAVLPDELAEPAFCNACDLVLADQGIEDEEKEYLSRLRTALSIDRDQAQKIFRVMVIKNRG